MSRLSATRQRRESRRPSHSHQCHTHTPRRPFRKNDDFKNSNGFGERSWQQTDVIRTPSLPLIPPLRFACGSPAHEAAGGHGLLPYQPTALPFVRLSSRVQKWASWCTAGLSNPLAYILGPSGVRQKDWQFWCTHEGLIMYEIKGKKGVDAFPGGRDGG